MKKVAVFLIFSILIFSGNDRIKSNFINVGNLKIVREEKIKITKQIINIKFLKEDKISVKTKYFLENTDNRDVKETYLFSLDQVLGDKPNKYIEKIKFRVDGNSVPNLRAVINFDEGNKIQREWFGIGSKISMKKPIVMEVSYILKNIENNELNYSFEIKNNFLENKADLLEINIDKGKRDIKDINYDVYKFYENEDGTYYMYGNNVKLDGVLSIKYE